MIVTILGSGTGVPHPERASPGFLIEVGGERMLVDPSSGSLGRMATLGFDYRTLDSVLFSHYHPDHTGDLAPLLFALRIDPGTGRQLTLIGSPGLKRFLDALALLYGSWVVESERLIVQETSKLDRRFRGCALTSGPVLHTENSLGYRWDGGPGRVFAYSGDSDYCASLVDLVKGADVALIEASHPRQQKCDGHLSGVLAGRVAAEAEVKRLLICHRYPAWDGHDLLEEIRAGGYAGATEAARDGMRIEL